MQQNSLAVKRPAVPLRLSKTPLLRAGAAPAQFISRPGGREIAGKEKKLSVVAVGVGKSRLKIECAAIMGGRLLEIAQLLKYHAKTIVGFGKIWLQFDRTTVRRERRVIVAELLQCIAQIVMSLREIGLEGDRLPIMSSGFVQLAGVLRCQADIAVSFSIVRLELHRLAVAGERLIAVPLVLEDIAEVEVGLGIVGLQFKRPSDVPIRRVELTGLMRELAEAVPRLSMMGISIQDLAVSSLGNLQTAGPVMIDGRRKHFTQRGHTNMITAILRLLSCQPKVLRRLSFFDGVGERRFRVVFGGDHLNHSFGALARRIDFAAGGFDLECATSA